MKSPMSLTLGELAQIAERASIKADKQARVAGIQFAGIVKKPSKSKRPGRNARKTSQTA